MANVQIKVDDSLRDEAQTVAAGMGIDLASAVRMFLVQMVRENGLPFRPQGDPFYSTQNQTSLKLSIAQVEQGRTVSKSLDELNSME